MCGLSRDNVGGKPKEVSSRVFEIDNVSTEPSSSKDREVPSENPFICTLQTISEQLYLSFPGGTSPVRSVSVRPGR